MLSSAQLSDAISKEDFSSCAATVVGYGYMGKEYVKALRALGVKKIHVCSRRADSLADLANFPEIETLSGDFRDLEIKPLDQELAILAVPTNDLLAASDHLAKLGFKKLLIEKPVALYAKEIEALDRRLKERGVEAFCAYNRLAYPSFCEVRARAASEGGPTSCSYTFTEMIESNWTQKFSANELARWGIANSLHVIGMAHGFIGLAETFESYRSALDRLEWHPTGSIFVGAGISKMGIPFSYHADWGSKGRWSVEVHTREAAYRLCPLEQVLWKTKPTGEWENLPIRAFSSETKAGVLEEVAGVLKPSLRSAMAVPSLAETAELTRFAENVFGYH